MFGVVQVPENYTPLVIKYLVGIRGGAREASTREYIVVGDAEFGLQKLIGECVSKISASEDAPMQGAKPFDDSAKVESTINQQPNTSRALSILHALNKSS